MTLLEARDAGADAAEQADGGPWAFSHVYLRGGEWTAVLGREPTIRDIAAAVSRGNHPLAERMAWTGVDPDDVTDQPELLAIARAAKPARGVRIVRHVVVGRL